MLFLASLAAAADIPAGANVVVAREADLAGGPDTVVPAISGVGWPAVVVKDEGDRLRVTLAEHGCTAPLVQTQALDVTYTVAEADLVPLLDRDVSGTTPAVPGGGSEPWFVGAGTPARIVTPGSARLTLDDGRGGVEVDLPVPSDAVSAYTMTVGERVHEHHFVGVEAVATDGIIGTFGGSPFGDPAWTNTEVDAGLAVWTGRCAAVTFHPTTTPQPFEPHRGAVGGVVGLMPWATVPAGTHLYWTDGTDAGTATSGLRLSGDRLTFVSLSCTAVPFSDVWNYLAANLLICVRTRDVVIVETKARPQR